MDVRTTMWKSTRRKHRSEKEKEFGAAGGADEIKTDVAAAGGAGETTVGAKMECQNKEKEPWLGSTSYNYIPT